MYFENFQKNLSSIEIYPTNSTNSKQLKHPHSIVIKGKVSGCKNLSRKLSVLKRKYCFATEKH